MVAPAPWSGPPVLEYHGVELDGGTASPLRELDLRIDGGGITTSGLADVGSRTVRWSELSDPRCGAPAAQLDGRAAVTISGEVGGRMLRWLVPAVQLRPTDAMTLDRALARLPVVGVALTGAVASVMPFGGTPPGPDPLAAPPPPATPWENEPPTLANFSAPASATAPGIAPGTAGPPPADAPGSRTWPAAAYPASSPVAYPAAYTPAYPAPFAATTAHRMGAWGASPSDAPGPGMPWAAPRSWPPPVRRAPGPARAVFALLLGAVALLVGAAIVIPFAFDPPPAAPGHSVVGGDQEVARQINLVQPDLPTGWNAEAPGQSPLSGLLGTSGSQSSSLTPAQRAQIAQIDGTYERCMGISAADDRIFGSAGATPTADASSPAFAGPAGSGHVEAGTNVVLYRSAASVRADQAQTGESQFPSCFGAAFASLLTSGASGTGSSTTVGTPQVSALVLPGRAGVATVGASVTLPVSSATASSSTQIGVVLVSGGRSEATIYTFASPGSFPPDLMTSLTETLQRNVATAGSGTGA